VPHVQQKREGDACRLPESRGVLLLEPEGIKLTLGGRGCVPGGAAVGGGGRQGTPFTGIS